MSPSTAPASIEASCPGSPTSTSRASGRSASTSLRHQRQRHHRGLVDDHDVVGEAVAAVVAEAAVAARPPAEQPVQRRGLQPASSCAGRSKLTSSPSGLLVDRLLEPRRGLAGRGRERDQRPGRPGGRRLLGQQRDDPRDRRRLAGARAAGHDREAGAAPPRPRPGTGGRRSGPGTAAPALRPAARSARRDRRPRPSHADRAPAGAPRPSSGRGTARYRPASADERPASAPRQRRGGCAPAACIQPAGSGQGSDDTSTGSSESTAAVSRIVARSTWTCAEARRADRERDARASPTRRPRRRSPPASSATWTSAARQHARPR